MWPPTAIRRRTPTRGMNTHPWAAAPTAPTTADTADDSHPDLLPKRECKIPLTSTGLGRGARRGKRGRRASGHHVSLCQLLANACMAASRVGS